MVRGSGRFYHVDSVESGEGRDWPGWRERPPSLPGSLGAAVHRHTLDRMNAIKYDSLK